MEESIIYAKKYLEDILSFFGLNTEVHASSSEGEVIEINIPSTYLNGFLIGQQGETMRAMQFTISNALKNNGYEITRVSIDVADYKKARADRLAETAETWINEVKTTGNDKSLEPMNSADRRTIHRVASEHGLVTESVGVGRDRHIVLKSPES